MTTVRSNQDCYILSSRSFNVSHNYRVIISIPTQPTTKEGEFVEAESATHLFCGNFM